MITDCLTSRSTTFKMDPPACLAHTIHLFVKYALKVIKSTVETVKEIVGFLQWSTKATEKLQSIDQQMNISKLKLKQECVTRLNSIFHLLKMILDWKDAAISTLALIDWPCWSSEAMRNRRYRRRHAPLWSHLSRSHRRSVHTVTNYIKLYHYELVYYWFEKNTRHQWK